MNSTSAVILLAGPIVVTGRLRDQVRDLPVIAADSGIRHARELDLDVEVWVGDFDSVPGDIAAEFADVERVTFESDKDITDGAIAIETALKRGAKRLILVGALGGASGHAIAHTAMAVDLRQEGIDVLLTSGNEEAVPLVAGATRMDLPVGAGLTIVGYSEIDGLTLRGVRWPLTDHRVPLGSSLTVSNEVTGPVRIDIAKGYGVAVAELAGGDQPV